MSYCLLVTQRTNKKGRLLEILTGEGKSCVIAMVAATYALMGRTVDIVTSSPVLSQRDAEEWREFYSVMKLNTDCNIDDPDEDSQCYDCPIVYGTVETFARDILKTEFLLQDVRKGRKCDIVIVDEVDSTLIDQGVQCTYLSHDVASIGMRHFEPILRLIWMHVSMYTPVNFESGSIFYKLEPEVFIMLLYRLSNDIDLLQFVRLAEEDGGIEKGFTNKFFSDDMTRLNEYLRNLKAGDVERFFLFARKILHLEFDIYYDIDEMEKCIQQNMDDRARISILILDDGQSVLVLHEDIVKDHLTKKITHSFIIASNENEIKIDLPLHLKDYCIGRLLYWIDKAFLAMEMQPERDYVIEGDAIYPVDYKSTGVVETNKKWGDGLQQFLEMKHGLPSSPLSLITNYLSNIDFFDRYGSNIVGVSGTLGDDAEKQFMSDTFSVEFATIPTSKRRKLFELDGEAHFYEDPWFKAVSKRVELVIRSKRAILVICEDIATATKIHKEIMKTNRIKRWISSDEDNTTPYLHTKSDGYDEGRMNKVLKPGDVVITTNLGARGTDFVTDDVVNKNGGLFVLVTFIPLNDRVEKQAFGRTGRRGATGSCQIIVNRKTMPEWLSSCETVNEVKRVRDCIDIHRLKNMTEVHLMRNKQNLFREYCEWKEKFITSCPNNSDNLRIQEEILDETWAKWIQNYETLDHGSNNTDMVQELRRVLEACSKRANEFESDNIYHILKFGAVRIMKGDFEGASKFYDQVIRMDPAWSAFAHYNRAYCTIQMKSDGYIRRAIDDLNATLSKLETYKTQCLFSYYNINNNSLTQYYIMMECQLFHHIDSQINETIEKLETINTLMGEMTTVRRDILDLIPGADRRTEKMLQEYRQLGLTFTYNIQEQPQFCHSNLIMSSFVMLGSVATLFLKLYLKGEIIGNYIEFKDTFDAVCNIVSINDESSGWMSRCVSRAITIGINSIEIIRDVSSLNPIKQTELESRYKMANDTSQFEQFANSEAESIIKLFESMTQEMKNLVSSPDEEICIRTTEIVMNVLERSIQLTIYENIKPGQELHNELCCLYDNQSLSDLQQYTDCISDLAQFLAHSSLLSNADFQTELQKIVKLTYDSNTAIESLTYDSNTAIESLTYDSNTSIESLTYDSNTAIESLTYDSNTAIESLTYDSNTAIESLTYDSNTAIESLTSQVETIAAEIEIGALVTKFSDFLCDNNNNNNNTAGDAPYVNENILSNMKKLNRRRGRGGLSATV